MARIARATIRGVLAVILLSPGGTMAQVNTGVFEILAVDEAGLPVPGAVVRVSSPESGFQIETVTNATGGARIPAVPPGTYDVSFELSGLQPLVQRAVALRVGQTISVHATLQPVLTERVVVVGGAPMVDVHKTDTSTNIVPEQIHALPVPDRDFQRLAFIAPSVQRERGEFRFVTGGPVIGAGGNASQSTILVDGADFTDPALGLAITRFSQDAIREFRVVSNRLDAEVGGSAGGALSIVTQSGANTVAGKAFAFLRDDALRASGALEQDKLPYARHQLGTTIGGPLAKDRTHAFASAEYINEDNIGLFRPGGAFAGRRADLGVPFDQTLLFARVDHQRAATNRFAVRGVYERFRQQNFRVGGVQDASYGQQLNRDNWSVGGDHVWVGVRALNQLYVHGARRRYDEPRNSSTVAEWFSSGNTLRTGGNILGDLLGEGTNLEVRNTHTLLRTAHHIKLGGGLQHVRERSRIDVYQSGLFIYVTDSRALPLAYAFGTGSSDIRVATTRLSAYVQDDWTVTPAVSVKLGARYDVDTNGNNAGFRHPLLPDGRPIDVDNVQPRAALSWDVSGTGASVIRGGVGRFAGRYLLVPAIAELQQNGESGRVLHTRLNGALLGLPAFALDVSRPEQTGLLLPPDIGLIDRRLDAPVATQLSGGWTMRLGGSGLFLDADAAYVRGRNEIVVRDTNFGGNANPVRLNPAYAQINTYTNEGRSDYRALILSVNGTARGGHLISASYTLASKKNVADDFSPEFPFGYPDDPAVIAAEYGRSRSDERHRLVLSGVFRMPFDLTVAGIYEYGSGQPWTHRLGYDFNGDGKNSDRPAGIERFAENGPRFQQLSARATKSLTLPWSRVDLIAEVFNLFNTTNFDPASIDGAEFLAGPTLAAPGAVAQRNPSFGRSRATLPSREVQLGARWSF